MKLINYYLIAINIYQFIQMGIDKYFAIKNKRRISEKTLILTSLIGGSLGGILGMQCFKHKTKKIKFHIFYILFLILQIYLYLYIKKALN